MTVKAEKAVAGGSNELGHIDLVEAIYTRRAVREFTSEPVDSETIRQLIDAAIQAPSAVNEQSWAFSVVRDKAVLARISGEAKALMLKAPPKGLPSRHFAELSDPDYDIFYHAPVLIVISSTSAWHWAVENCSLAAENLMLAARAAGLGTCWIGFAQTWLNTPEGKSSLGLPSGYVPIAPIIVGHPMHEAPPVPRKEPEVHWI